jgi:3-oxoadipate enol-lactonase
MIPAHDTVLYVQDAGRGRTLLFIHGACGDANIWDEPIRTLMGEFRCVAYDRRGHTRSPRGLLLRSSIGHHAADAADVIAALDLGPAVVIGSDHGGDIALELARRHPHLVDAAILCGPPLQSVVSASVAEYWKMVTSAVAAAPTPRASVDAMFEVFGTGSWARMPGARREAARSNYAALQVALTPPESTLTPSDLRTCAMLAWVVIGDDCPPCALRAASDIAASVPRAELVCVSGAGALVYVDQPRVFSEMVRSFALQVSGDQIGPGVDRKPS